MQLHTRNIHGIWLEAWWYGFTDAVCNDDLKAAWHVHTCQAAFRLGMHIHVRAKNITAVNSMHMGYFDLKRVNVILGLSLDLDHVKVVLGSFGALFPKLYCSLKMAHRRVKHENLVSENLCSMHMGTLDVDIVKVIWGHSVHFSQHWAVSRRRLIIVQKQMKI